MVAAASATERRVPVRGAVAGAVGVGVGVGVGLGVGRTPTQLTSSCPHKVQIQPRLGIVILQAHAGAA